MWRPLPANSEPTVLSPGAHSTVCVNQGWFTNTGWRTCGYSDEPVADILAAVQGERLAVKRNPVLDVAEIRQKILPILERHRATRAGLFGSAARGEMTEHSDIDLLVELGDDLSLLDVVGIAQELEDALGRSVDLVEYEAIKPLLRERILAEEIRIL